MSQAEDDQADNKKTDNLINDIEYLIYELEALKTVIGEVEYNDQPPVGDQLSILDKIRLLGYIQKNYYEELIKSVVEDKESKVTLKRQEVSETFTKYVSGKEEKQEQDVDSLLSEIVRQRKQLLNRLKEFKNHHWEQEFERNEHEHEGNEKLTLHSLMNEMVRFERKELKEIVEIIQIMSIDKEQRRQVKDREK